MTRDRAAAVPLCSKYKQLFHEKQHLNGDIFAISPFFLYFNVIPREVTAPRGLVLRPTVATEQRRRLDGRERSRERPAHLQAGNDAPRDTGTTQDRTGSRARTTSGEMAVKSAAVYLVRGAWLIHTIQGEATHQPANRDKIAGGWGANYPPARKKREARSPFTSRARRNGRAIT